MSPRPWPKVRSPFDDDNYQGNDKQISDLKALARELLSEMQNAIDNEEGNWKHDDEPVWMINFRELIKTHGEYM